MLKPKPALLGLPLALFLLSGCASTTTPCDPVVVRPRPPENLLVRPKEPLLLTPGLRPPASGTSHGFMPKTLPDGLSAVRN